MKNLYYFKVEKKDELLDGRSIKYVSNCCGVSRQTLSNIFNGKVVTTEEVINKIFNVLKKDSLKVNYLLNVLGKKLTILYFFKKTT